MNQKTGSIQLTVDQKEINLPNLSVLNHLAPFNLISQLRQLWSKVKNDQTNKTETKHRHSNREKMFSHKVDDDKEIKFFNIQILNSTLKLFENIRKISEGYYSQRYIKRCSKLYKDKFKKFLDDIKSQKIESQTAVKKVILNSIDVSNHIVTRLLNLMMSDIDKAGFVDFSRSIDLFRAELKKEKMRQLNSACSDLSICRSGGGVTQFVIDILDRTVKLNITEFRKVFDSLCTAVSKTDFKLAFGEEGDIALKNVSIQYRKKDVLQQTKGLSILRNIIITRNIPLSVVEKEELSEIRVQKTVALQNIFILLDESVPNTFDNLSQWSRIQTDFELWIQEGSPDIQQVMLNFVEYFRDIFEALDPQAHKVLIDNLRLLFV